MKNNFENLEQDEKIEFIIDVFNLAVIYKIIPEEIIDRARIRCRIKKLRSYDILTEKEQVEFEKLQNREMKLQQELEKITNSKNLDVSNT